MKSCLLLLLCIISAVKATGSGKCIVFFYGQVIRLDFMADKALTMFRTDLFYDYFAGKIVT